MLVDRTLTPLTVRQMAGVLATVRGELSTVALENILAIAALENGNGKKIVQHNWGNVMATEAWRAKHDFWERKDPTVKPRFFRAYPSHAQGAEAFLKLLQSSRHQGAVGAAQADDTGAMVDSLFASAYVVPVPAAQHSRGLSAAEQQAEYSGAVRSIREKYRSTKPFGQLSQGELGPGAAVAAGVFIVLAGLGLYRFWGAR